MSDGMDIAHSLHSEVTGLSFSFLSSDDIRSISVKKIDNPVLLDNLSLPTRGGLYDPSLGPMNSRDICETCHLTGHQCPGHYGHIELASPLYHPLFMNQCYQLLRSVCLYCHHFKMPEITLRRYIARLRLLDAGCLEEAHYIAEFHPVSKSSAKDEEEDAVDQAVPAESAAEFVLRMEQYVKAVLKSKKKKHVRDDYKDDLVYQERRKVLNEFGKKAYARCSHCTAFGNTFRKEKAVKIIEYDLTPKQKLANQASNLRRTSPSFGKKHKSKAASDDEGLEASASGSSASEEEDDAMEVDESEEDEDEDEGIVNDGVARTASGQVKGVRGRNERVMAAAEVRDHLRRLFQLESEICSLLYGRHGAPSAGSTDPVPPPIADMFFMDVIPVTPTRFRPPARMGDDLFENAQNSLLNAVIQTCIRTREINQTLLDLDNQDKSEELMERLKSIDKNRTFELLLESLVKLQNDVNSFMDSTKNPTVMKQGKLPPQGVKQLLEKKEGLFRKHMMGKRVNYAARSVISPDINVETNEIGIPPVFAKKLTYPEPVTANNVAEMRQLVINGPKIHPGAAIVQNEDGSKVSLDRMTLEQRTALANQLLTPQNDSFVGSSSGPAPRNKKVYRHIRDGDIVILNRQPTLHKPSMMCHRVKVLKGEKTIRMHYANCNSYNADFDGDEMNIHFPQNEIARAEAQMLANTDNQYLVPTSGDPLRGLIQDHVDAGVWMLNKSSYFTREEYYQLVYGALRTEDNYTAHSRIITLPPAIWKPKAMWTGKQIISTILANLTPLNAKGLNLDSQNKISNALWKRDDSKDKELSEEDVLFLDGHLLRGILDKSQFGASKYGLVHSVHEIYGPYIANRLLGVLSRLFTKYLQHTAFSCRMDDLVLTAEGERLRHKYLNDASDDGRKAAMKFVGLPPAPASDKEAAKNLRIRLEEILHDNNMMAGLDAEMQATFNQTTSALNKDVLPEHLIRPFPYNNMQTMTISGAKGSKVNAQQISTLLGSQSLEGRRVPVMVSGKTLPSFQPFDTAARAGGYVANRFLTGIRPQEYYFHCMAGREGLIDTAVKTARSGYLQRCLIKHLEGVRVHYDHTVRDSDSSVLQFMYGEDGVDVTKSRHLEKFDFSCRNHESLIQKFRPQDLEGKVIMDEAVDHMKKALKKPHKYEPAMSKYTPSRYLGAMSEAYAKKVNNYIKENKHGLIRRKGGDEQKSSPYIPSSAQINERDFQQLARVRFMRSLVDPGEAVGLLASQGVGEPSTQMTLNTFHLAGHGAANVTLGIPRLREIVMTAARKPATPTMKLPLRDHITDEDIDMFCKQVTRLKLSEVVDKVTVTERLSGKMADANNSRLRKYTVHIQFYPAKEYQDEYKITKEQLHESLATSFALRLKREIVAELRNSAKTKEQDQAVGKGLRMRSDDADESGPTRRGRDDELDDGDDDEDSGQLKRARQRKQHEYDEDEGPASKVVDLEDYLENGSEGDDSEDEDMDANPTAKAAADTVADTLAEQFKQAAKFAHSFSFDQYKGESAEFELQFPGQAPKLLLVDIIERACRNSVVHEIDQIGRCIKVFDDKGKFTRELLTEGSNIRGMWSLADELIDLDRITSNDVYAILTVFGVEAARASILSEISGVFKAYNIGVDIRHLYLIADAMTRSGSYNAFNRTVMCNRSAPLLKASFETSMAVLAETTLAGDFDNLTSPASRIVMGKPAQSGTGSFDVRAPRHI